MSTPDPAARFYQGDSGEQYHQGKRALAPPALDWVMNLRARKFQSHVRPEDIVFELGVGAGWNLARLKCARRIGCDTADFLRARLTALGIEFLPDLNQAPDKTADVAICHQTLEHLLRPTEALTSLARILKPGGLLLLHVPWERERRYAHFHSHDPNHHLFNWNAQNLGNLVTVMGYRIESLTVQRYGYDRFAANLAARLRIGEHGFRMLRAILVALRPFLEVALLARKEPGVASRP